MRKIVDFIGGSGTGADVRRWDFDRDWPDIVALQLALVVTLLSRPRIAHQLVPDDRRMIEKLEDILGTCTGDDPTGHLQRTDEHKASTRYDMIAHGGGDRRYSFLFLQVEREGPNDAVPLVIGGHTT